MPLEYILNYKITDEKFERKILKRDIITISRLGTMYFYALSGHFYF